MQHPKITPKDSIGSCLNEIRYPGRLPAGLAFNSCPGFLLHFAQLASHGQELERVARRAGVVVVVKVGIRHRDLRLHLFQLVNPWQQFFFRIGVLVPDGLAPSVPPYVRMS